MKEIQAIKLALQQQGMDEDEINKHIEQLQGKNEKPPLELKVDLEDIKVNMKDGPLSPIVIDEENMAPSLRTEKKTTLGKLDAASVDYSKLNKL